MVWLTWVSSNTGLLNQNSTAARRKTRVLGGIIMKAFAELNPK